MDKTPHDLMRDGRSAARHLASLSAQQCLVERDANRLMSKILAGLRVTLTLAPHSEAVLDANAAGFRLAHAIGERDLQERQADHDLPLVLAAFDLLLPLGAPRPAVSEELMDRLRATGLRTGRELARMVEEAADRTAACGTSVLDWGRPEPEEPSDLPETLARLRAIVDQGQDRIRTVGIFGVIKGGLA